MNFCKFLGFLRPKPSVSVKDTTKEKIPQPEYQVGFSPIPGDLSEHQALFKLREIIGSQAAVNRTPSCHRVGIMVNGAFLEMASGPSYGDAMLLLIAKSIHNKARPYPAE